MEPAVTDGVVQWVISCHVNATHIFVDVDLARANALNPSNGVVIAAPNRNRVVGEFCAEVYGPAARSIIAENIASRLRLGTTDHDPVGGLVQENAAVGLGDLGVKRRIPAGR